MYQRIAYEQKMLCGKWVEQQADFASVLQAVDFCADKNEQTGAYRYRVKVIADPNVSNEAAPISAKYDELMVRFTAA
jgi:hypothetical protein